MGILSGPEIRRQVELGGIIIDPFDPARLGPNSYDVCLGRSLVLLKDIDFDLTVSLKSIDRFDIPEDGFDLQPHVGYLAHTVERICGKGFVPWIDGRSTIGRYFLQCHQTAGRGDDGWEGQFTLELMATYRHVRVYAGLPIAQVSFFKLEGERAPYCGRYSGQTVPMPPKPLRLPERK